MPEYGFECYEEDGGCNCQFDITCSRDDIEGKKPKCPNCKKKKAVSRNFSLGNVIVFDATPQTVGALADKNGDKVSADERAYLKSKYIQKPKFTGALPDGASLPTRDSQGKIGSLGKGKNHGRVKHVKRLD